MGANETVIAALRTVPEKRLLIVDLAREIIRPDGEVSYDEAQRRSGEINLAVAEARAYTMATERAREAIAELLNGRRHLGTGIAPRILIDDDGDEDLDEDDDA